MLDLRFIRDNVELTRERLAARGAAPSTLDEFVQLDAERRALLAEVEGLRQRRNELSKEVAELKRQGKSTSDVVARVVVEAPLLTGLEKQLKEKEELLQEAALFLPNLPHASVPIGKSAEDNVEIRRWGIPRQFDFAPKSHWELGEALGILDFERAAAIAQSRFAVLKGVGARLERALISFMLDLHGKEHGYTEIFPPLLVNADAMRGTGQLPKFGEDLFKTKDEGLYMIPTAEVPVTNLHREEILPPGTLPLSYVASTPCFRREAGSYGKDTRGLMRQHQFNKVELVKFAEPERSHDALEEMTRHAETVLQRLGLPYRVVVLCTADLGFAAAKTYDIELWIPSQGAYREVSSISNCETFQARRANIRYRPSPKAVPQFVHTLNGSGVAAGRTWLAILENFQEADGTVVIPEALRPYLDGLERIRK
ncbi:serine--tRNA ligase [Candidatus Methylomirabilis limnetica]|uniref:Serine--tRNA ligase n=1 Tax=Candidatus Methylomirabilis limnetica TaxID=2033718 RepID=A0A2T4U0N2_9BACT|nr:serine--tRNA ligase [Candidatus Methylomirabilis limnetica]PTL36911.1 serine--tRNA ligase [Candidatus Methylomirabilis limnetica]